MKINDIIVLENEERYTLMEEVMYENEKYFLALPIDEKGKIDNSKPKMFKSVKEPDGEYVVLVRDEYTILNLSKLLKDAK